MPTKRDLQWYRHSKDKRMGLSRANPVLSALAISGISGSGATVTWTTDVPCTSQVEYGRSQYMGSFSTLSASLVTSHSVVLSGLSGSSWYNIRALSRASTGELVMSGITGFTAAPVWSYVGNLNTARWNYSMVKLVSGRVLIIGGSTDAGAGETNTAVCELFDPSTNLWTTTGSLSQARGWSKSVVLQNGQVLVVGGYNNPSHLATCELYNPNTGAWTATGALATARSQYGLWLLSNGKVLVAGGASTAGADLSSSELYNPATGTWSATGALPIAVRYPITATLGDGRPLCTGGTINAGANGCTNVQTYNIGAGTWTVKTASTDKMDSQQGCCAIPMANGNVILAGPGIDEAPFLFLRSYIFDQTTDLWARTGDYPQVVSAPNLFLKANGTIVAAGGSSDLATSGIAYCSTFSGSTWTAASPLNAARNWGNLNPGVLLNDGRCLMAGGIGVNVGSILSTCEVFSA